MTSTVSTTTVINIYHSMEGVMIAGDLDKIIEYIEINL